MMNGPELLDELLKAEPSPSARACRAASIVRSAGRNLRDPRGTCTRDLVGSRGADERLQELAGIYDHPRRQLVARRMLDIMAAIGGREQGAPHGRPRSPSSVLKSRSGRPCSPQAYLSVTARERLMPTDDRLTAIASERWPTGRVGLLVLTRSAQPQRESDSREEQLGTDSCTTHQQLSVTEHPDDLISHLPEGSVQESVREQQTRVTETGTWCSRRCLNQVVNDYFDSLIRVESRHDGRISIALNGEVRISGSLSGRPTVRPVNHQPIFPASVAGLLDDDGLREPRSGQVPTSASRRGPQGTAYSPSKILS